MQKNWLMSVLGADFQPITTLWLVWGKNHHITLYITGALQYIWYPVDAQLVFVKSE